MPRGLQQAGQVGGRRLALQVRVGGDDDLLDPVVGEAVEQLADVKLVGADAGDWIDGATEHVVPAAEGTGPLNGHNVLGLLDHAQRGLVAARVAADRARVLLGDVEADRAELHPLLDRTDRVGEALHVLGVRLEDMERDALRGLGSHAGQPAELVDQFLDCTLVHLRSHCLILLFPITDRG